MADQKNAIKIDIIAEVKNINTVAATIRKQFSSISESTKSILSGIGKDGAFRNGLQQLKDDIAAGTKPAQELQSQFENLQKSLMPANEQIRELKENLAIVQANIARIEAKNPKSKQLSSLKADAKVTAKDLSVLTTAYNANKAELKDVEKEIKKFTKAEEQNTKVLEDNNKKVTENAASLYQLNAAMTIAKQTMKAIYGILTSTSDAYARNALSMKAYELTFNNLGDSSNELTNNLNAMVDSLEAFGYNRSDVQQMAVDFYSLATAVGVSKNAAVNMTSDYLKMANRISVATGETLENVTQMISSAISTGRATGVLTGLSIDLREESIKKLAVERGLIQSENEDLSQSEMYMLRQYALTDAILKNQNLLNNSGNKYLVQQTQINNQIKSLKENIGELVQGPVTAIMGVLKGALDGINSIITAINKTPVLKNIVSIIGMIGVGLLSVFATVTIIKAGLDKVSKVLNVIYPQTTKWGMAMQGVAKWSLSIISMASSIAMIIGGIISLQDKGIEKTTEKLDEQEEQTDDTIKSVKKLKNELMGFDEINLLSKDNESTFSLESFMQEYESLQEKLDTSAVDDLAKSFENLSKIGSVVSIVMGAITLATNGYLVATKLLNKEKTKQIATETAASAAGVKGAVSLGGLTAKTTENTIATNINTAAQNKWNISKAMGLTLIGGAALVGAAIGTGITFALMQNSSMEKSANGNYFPSASATIIGEKYPEVAIPLGNSPQYADMQETIANKTAERLSEMNGFNGTVNVYIGNEQLRDFAVEAVNDNLRTNYGTNLGKIARS